VLDFVAAWVIGPRLARDREIDAPNNLAMVAIGSGLCGSAGTASTAATRTTPAPDASGSPEHERRHGGARFLVVGCDYLTKRKPSLIGASTA
jgi:hypothetical protein